MSRVVTKKWQLRCSLWAILLVSLLLASVAQARKPTAKEQALSHLKEGNLRFANGDLEGALENYRLADKFYKSPKIDYSIGNVLFEMKLYAQAERLFKKYLAAPGKSSKKLIYAAKKKQKTIEETIAGMNKGGLLIKSVPPGATATLAGRPLEGITPITVKDLAPRIYDLVVRKDDIYRYETTIQIEPDNYKTVTAVLSKIKGTLDVTSNPPEASIQLDGKFLGNTPRVLKGVEAGSHTLVLTKKGYAKWKQNVTLSKENNKQSIEATMEKSGYLFLQSIPEGAKVYYGTRYIGQTPVKVPAPPKEYVLRFTMDKMETVERIVTVESNEEAVIAVAMKLSAEEIQRRKKMEEEKIKRAEELARLREAALALSKKHEEAKRKKAREATIKRQEEKARKEAQRKASANDRTKQANLSSEVIDIKEQKQVDFSEINNVKETKSTAPIYKKWWFWAIVGVAVVGGAVGGVVAGTTGGDDWVASGVDGRFSLGDFK